MLLSICIPTYNRSRYLQSCLNSILCQLEEDMDIEIIISDNDSSDDTEKISRPYLTNTKLKYFKQSSNIGATKNYRKLVEKYAQGEFCWIVGDDDFLKQGALKEVIKLLEANKHDTDYIYASVESIDVEKYRSFNTLFDTSLLDEKFHIKNLNYEKDKKFEELISPKYSLFFLGELMASIFRREIWLLHDIDTEGVNLESLNTTYPHSVILAKQFFGRKSIYIDTPLIAALEGGREWWPKVGYIIVEHVKSLLDFYNALGLPKKILKECYKQYLAISFKYYLNFLFNLKSPNRAKISHVRYLKFLITNPSICGSFVFEKLENQVKKIIK